MGYDVDSPCPEINDLDEQRLNPCYNGMTIEHAKDLQPAEVK